MSLRLASLLVLACWAATANGRDLLVHADRLHTQAGPTIEDGAVLVRDGRIVAVGRRDQVAAPEGVRLIHAAVVTPGLVDARSVVGLSGYLNQPHDQDQLEVSTPMQPQLRAIDAYNPRERLVEWLREHGVTTIHTGHGTGALVSGQTMVLKSRGDSVEDALVVPLAMVAGQLGPGALSLEGKAPGTRSKQMALLRQQLVKAGEYRDRLAKAKADARPTRDLELEVLVQVLDRSRPLLITAHRAQDILSALRLAQEFDVRLVLDGAAEAYLVIDALRAAGVPVILHPTMARQFGELENASFGTAAALHRAGIPFALQSGFEAYVPKTRVVLWEAAIAARHGLPFEPALASITRDAARIIGVGDRVGTLEVGKDGDLALFDGDPFEYTTHVTAVVIEGVVVSETLR